LRVQNDLDAPVFLLDGEELAGARPGQERQAGAAFYG
jgi:hypothetical protein